MKMRNKLLIIIGICGIAAALGGALGFNTLDWMTHIAPYETWCFVWGIPPKVCMPFWWGYFLGGILPLFLSGLATGIIIGIAIVSLLRKKKKLSAQK